jgi:predicted nucleotidyltransferase/DNA-binding transcriptional ArsR family regulator
VRIIASELALRVLVALRARSPLSLTELARAVGASASSVQGALDALLADHLVSSEGTGKRRRYRSVTTEAASHLVRFALLTLPHQELLGITARAHPAIEFMATRTGELVVVFSAAAGALEEADVAATLGEICKRAELRPRFLYHDDVRRELLIDPGLRERMASTAILHGTLDRTFPDRSRHARTEGRPLGRAHSAVRIPSGRLLRRLAKDHGLVSLRLFGSAVRSDFRPDSDVDVAVRFRPDVRPTLRSLSEIEQVLELAMGRDVDLLDEESLDSEVRDAIEKEAVALL